MVVSVCLLSLLNLLEPGQFAAVEDLIFFLKGMPLSTAVVFPRKKTGFFSILQPAFLIHGAFQRS